MHRILPGEDGGRWLRDRILQRWQWSVSIRVLHSLPGPSAELLPSASGTVIFTG